MSEAAVATRSEVAVASEEATATQMSPSTLAPSFLYGWKQVPPERPRDPFWVDYRLNNYTGDVVLQFGTRAHPPLPLTIGWTWTGWKRPGVYARAGDSFVLVARTGPVSIRPNGGHVVPRAFISLHGCGRPIESSVVIGSHRTHVVGVTAPYSAWYTVHAEFNMRSVVSGSATPYGEIIGRFVQVIHNRRYGAALADSAFAAGEREEMPQEVAELYQPEEREFSAEELTRELAARDEAPAIEIPDGPEAIAEQRVGNGPPWWTM